MIITKDELNSLMKNREFDQVYKCLRNEYQAILIECLKNNNIDDEDFKQKDIYYLCNRLNRLSEKYHGITMIITDMFQDEELTLYEALSEMLDNYNEVKEKLELV